MADAINSNFAPFYQPPRESPWLEAIEIQDSAFPYHDWNERIAAEWQAANAVSRSWDTEGKIAQLVNNYAGTSFDFGPTVFESVQVIHYAGRAVQLADQPFSDSFEPGFFEHRELARSNIPEQVTAAPIYEKWVRPAMLDMKDVGAHYALSQLFQDVGERSSISSLLHSDRFGMARPHDRRTDTPVLQ